MPADSVTICIEIVTYQNISRLEFYTMFRRILFLVKIYFALFFCFMFVACAGQQDHIPTAVANPVEYRTVAVISLLPRTYSMSYIGATVFGNHFAVFPLDFDPNQIVLATFKYFLAPHYQVRDLGLNEAALMDSIQKEYTWDYLANTSSLVQSQLKKLVKAGVVDLIIVIDGSRPNPVGKMGPLNAGVGLASIYQFDFGLSHLSGDESGVMAPVELFDGRSFQQVGLTAAGEMFGPPNYLKWKGQSYDMLSATDKALLREKAEQALGLYVAASLNDLHLIN